MLVPLERNARILHVIMEKGPFYVYFPEPEKIGHVYPVRSKE